MNKFSDFSFQFSVFKSCFHPSAIVRSCEWPSCEKCNCKVYRVSCVLVLLIKNSWRYFASLREKKQFLVLSVDNKKILRQSLVSRR